MYCFVDAKEDELVKSRVSYFEDLEAMGYRYGRDYVYNKIDKKISYKNGSEILFKSLDAPERFKSL